MTWTAPRTWSNETLTYPLLNVHLRDNLLETAPAKVTTAGDIVYATGANAITRLGIGSAGAVLVSRSGAPGWSSSGVTASSGLARSVNLAATITAAANGDNLQAFTASNMTWERGAYTGLTVSGVVLDCSGWSATGTGVISAAYGIYLDAPTVGTTNWTIYSNAGNMRLGGQSSSVYIGDTSNANMARGLTITAGSGGSYASEMLSLKDTGLNHGMTAVTETDTYMYVQGMTSVTGGGAEITGLNSSGVYPALSLNGYGGNTGTSKSTSARGQIELVAASPSGTGVTSVAADTPLVTISNNGTTRFIFDADGDSHEDGTGWTAYDDYDDVVLLGILDETLDRRLSAEAGEWMRANKAMLQAARIVTFNDDTDGVPFINRSRLSMLLVGAVRQIGERLAKIDRRLSAIGG